MFEHKKEFVMKQCPTAMCHASSLLKLKDRTILCAWFGGSKEGEDDVNIWMSRRVNGTWETPRIVSTEAEPNWNPVFFEVDENEILLFYKVGREIKKWRTMIMRSTDGGRTFGQPVEMVSGDQGGRGPVRNKPIRLSNGRILAPASLENGIWSAFVDSSDDNGLTWTKKPEVTITGIIGNINERTVKENESDIPVSEQSFYGRGVIQPTLWESTPGHVHMFLRSTEGKIYQSDSVDYGDTWTDAYPTNLPNNNSGIDVVKTENGNLFLVYNPVGVNWGPRSPISLAVSRNNGKTFELIVDLDEGKGEFAYPAIIADGNQVYVSYTWKRENIAFWQVSDK